MKTASESGIVIEQKVRREYMDCPFCDGRRVRTHFDGTLVWLRCETCRRVATITWGTWNRGDDEPKTLAEAEAQYPDFSQEPE